MDSDANRATSEQGGNNLAIPAIIACLAALND